MSTDTNYSVANAIHADTLADGDYIVIGHNNGSTTLTQTSDMSVLLERRAVREWKVQVTGTIAAVNLQFTSLHAITGE